VLELLKPRLDKGWSFLVGYEQAQKSFTCSLWRPIKPNERLMTNVRRIPEHIFFNHWYSSRLDHKTIEGAIKEALENIPKELE
jgi:hypothetical protein